MTLDEYQQAALTTARDDHGDTLQFMHRVLGLVGEAGEVADKVKKIVRDQQGERTPSDNEELAKELGDVLWYVAALSDLLDVPLEALAQSNLDKLQDRQRRGRIGGAGDNR